MPEDQKHIGSRREAAGFWNLPSASDNQFIRGVRHFLRRFNEHYAAPPPRRSVFALGKGVGCRVGEGEGGGSAT